MKNQNNIDDSITLSTTDTTNQSYSLNKTAADTMDESSIKDNNKEENNAFDFFEPNDNTKETEELSEEQLYNK